MSEPRASVVIPTRGRPALLDATLAALAAQDAAPGSFEVIVAIDGEDADSERVVAKRNGAVPVRSLTGPRQGQGQARNAGARAAAAAVIIFLDDDIIAVPGLVRAHLRHHAQPHTVVTGALPMEVHSPEPAHYRVVREWWDGELVEMAKPDHVASFRDFVTGNVSLERDWFLEHGGFNAVFTGYGREDYELGYRLLRAGARFVHEPAARGVHRYRKAAREWIRQWRSMGQADVRFRRLHPEAAAEIARLSPGPFMARRGLRERLVEAHAVAWHRRGGEWWSRTARYAQIAWYWEGVRAEARDGAELQAFREACEGRIPDPS